MLQAKTEKGELIIPAQLTKSELEKIRLQRFYCPVCQSRVMLKAGPQVMPHFAHYPNSRCPSLQQGESVKHKYGKILLYKWLKLQRLDVQLEVYIPQIRQQPDILLTIDDQKIAIEFQCSRIPIEHIQKRNKGYQQLNIEPMWILDETFLKQRKNTNLFLIDSFTRHFIHRFSSQFPLTLFYFNPSTKVFTQMQHIYLFTQSLAFAQINQFSLFKGTFHDLFHIQPFYKQRFFQHLYRRKRNFRIFPQNPYGSMRKWFEWLYLRGSHIQYLPSYVYLPLRSQIYMKTPLWDWQSRICLDVLKPLPIQGTFKLSFLQKRFHHTVIKREYFPLIKQLENPIIDYLNLLASFQIIKRIDSNIYVKLRPMSYPNHVEKAILSDRLFLEKWYKNFHLAYETGLN